MSRICAEVEAHLPALVDGSLPGWRRRLVEVHLRRCAGCRAELERQRAVAAELQVLREATDAVEEPPPDDLLDRLLDQAHDPGLRARAAGPARGAVSGARPALSVTLLVVGAAVGTGIGYAGWRLARALRGGRRHR